MKKILFIFIFTATLPVLLCAALTGDGTYASPWSGTLEGDMTWSGTKYINGDIIVDNEKLTINPGAIIVFISETADLIITGTGQIEADGNSSSMIRFTSDDNNNGTFGESGERWGHISFQDMTGSSASLIDYCIIEFGKVGTSPSVKENYGGGIHVDYSNLTISNSVIRNNYSGWGGGLFINIGENPTISNCLITNNIAANSGGGLYFYQNTSSLVQNCLIYNNTCTGGGGGGGIFLGDFAGDVRFYNCVISSNATALHNGNNIRLFVNTNPNRPRFYNSIIWGSDNSISYKTQTPSVTDFNFCAIQGYSGGYTSCINLNSNNTGTNPEGPNFTNPIGGDYSIVFKSPCRDAGTTPSPAVPYDYNGNSRIGSYDIGSYEVQYSRWNGTTSTAWSIGTNWEAGVDPSSGSGDVIIPYGLSNYPVNPSNPNFTLGSGKQMILNSGAKVTLGTLTNNGTLRLESDASNISTLIISSYSGNDAIVELYLTGGGGSAYKWHYVSSPVISLPVSTFILKPTMDFAQYFEARPSTEPMQGWIGFDGYIYYSGGFLTGLPYDIRGTNLIVGKGYNYYYASNQKLSFTGQLNVSSIYPTITYGGVSPSLQGFNLLGNPFSSGMDWTTIINDASFPTLTSKGLYFTRNNAQCSFIAGVGYPDQTVTGIIPPMQGFFIHTTNTSTTLPLLAGARAHNIPARYKGAEEIIPLVRVQLDNDSTKDNTVVRFDTKASATIDNDFDAVRMFLDETVPYIYSTDGNTRYAINGQPFPETSGEYPLTVNLTKTGNHSLNAIQLQGLDNYNVYLVDNSTGFTADLKTNPVVTFSASAGLVRDRFILKVTNVLTGNEAPVSSRGLFNIYNGQGFVNIQTLSDEWDGQQGSILVLDITGKTVSDLRNTGFSRNSIIRIPAPSVKGLYIIELRSGSKRYIGKVVIR